MDIKKEKIYYSDYHDEENGIKGFVVAECHNDYCIITKRAFDRACKKMKCENTAPHFHTDKHVLKKNYGNQIIF